MSPTPLPRANASTARHHLVLVPGFGGFAMLGSLRYYEGVIDVIRGEDLSAFPLCLHFFPNLPTASVATRAWNLGAWLAKRIHRGSILPGDPVHLVGHSTGGLDIRQLILQLHQDRDAAPFGDTPVKAATILEHVRTAQFLSTPHRGTNLARWVCLLRPLPRYLVRAMFAALRTAGPWPTGALAAGLQHLRGTSGHPDLFDALLCTLDDLRAGPSPYECSQSRAAYYDLLRYLEEMATDFAAIEDLHPLPVPWQETRCTPARCCGDAAAAEVRLYDERYHIRVRSLVTHAEPQSDGSRLNLFALAHALVRRDPPAGLGDDAGPLAWFDGAGQPRTLSFADNDGLVNSRAMIWPDRARSFLVCGDHADIIGHYGAGPRGRGFDLLPSAAPFDAATFQAIWLGIGRFAVAP